MPKSWTLSAFAPDDDEVPIPHDEFIAALPPDVQCDVQRKLSIAPWVLFPSIANASKRRLRGCPACFELGHHSYAFQDSLMAACPVHALPLSDRCPHCSTPLWWRHSTLHGSAFRCPRGCDLMAGLHVGLDDEKFDHLAQHLDRHLAVIERLRAQVRFVSGPTHFTYPPRLLQPDYDDIARPASGLIGAILAAIRRHVSDLPKLEAHHDLAGAAWEVQAQPVEPYAEIEAPGQKTRQMMAAFRRGTFRTELPLADSVSDALLSQLGMHAMIVNYRDVPQISIASYMLTNAEVRSLERILAGGDDASHAHYSLALRDILELTVARHREREDGTKQRDALAIAETISGLIKTPTQTLWIRGRTTTAGSTADTAWASFTESVDY